MEDELVSIYLSIITVTMDRTVVDNVVEFPGLLFSE
jgi:hypothetical protein